MYVFIVVLKKWTYIGCCSIYFFWSSQLKDWDVKDVVH